MGFLGRKLLVAQVWLSAVMLPIAGLPHFSCLCPDGRVKPFCFGPTTQTSGRCCRGSCCGSKPGEGSCAEAPRPARAGAKTRCCCCRSHAGEGKKQSASDARHRVSAPACRRTLTEADLIAILGERDSPGVSAGPITWLSAPPPTLLLPPPRLEHAQLSWQTYGQPPPTDLIILLLHFLI